MRKLQQRTIEHTGRPLSPRARRRSLRVAACVLGLGLCLATSVARAQDDDDEEDNRSFEDKIIHNILSGIGGKSMEDKGINYRERSPLVVPPKVDLPPPGYGKKEVDAPNWPNDPTVAARKAAAEAANKPKPTVQEMNRLLTPAEMAPKKNVRSARGSDVQQPGEAPNIYGGNNGGPMLSPSQLGGATSLFSIFKGNDKKEQAQFKNEPVRESVIQPPVGYQTPSPDYPYGTGGMQQPIDKQSYNPRDPNSTVPASR